MGGAFANVARTAWGGATAAVWDRFSPGDFWNRIRKSGAKPAELGCFDLVVIDEASQIRSALLPAC